MNIRNSILKVCELWGNISLIVFFLSNAPIERANLITNQIRHSVKRKEFLIPKKRGRIEIKILSFLAML